MVKLTEISRSADMSLTWFSYNHHQSYSGGIRDMKRETVVRIEVIAGFVLVALLYLLDWLR